MNSFLKYYSSLFSHKLHNIVGGTNTVKQYPSKKELLQNIPIKNKKLVKELEAAYSKKGFLAFSDFLEISQFGEYGYYNTHNHHGMTDTYLRWPKALITICQKEKYKQIIEFGCGDGLLGAATMKIAKKENIDISWTGIEINSQEVTKAKKLFAKYGIPSTKYEIRNTIDSLKLKNPCLLVFSYSLDSIPPELFINTTHKKVAPNGVIALKIINQKIHETIHPIDIQSKILNTKYLLFPRQRTLIPISAFALLKDCAQKLPKGSTILVIDEFTAPILPWETKDLNMPKDLDRFDPNREIKDFKTLYETTGENLLYFPNFLNIYIEMLKKLGGKNIVFDSEHVGAELIVKNKPLRNPKDLIRCYALMAGV